MKALLVGSIFALAASAASAASLCDPEPNSLPCEFVSESNSGICLDAQWLAIGVEQEPMICDRPPIGAGLVDVNCTYEEGAMSDAARFGLERRGAAVFLTSDAAEPLELQRCD
jgi:hypothetical protein